MQLTIESSLRLPFLNLLGIEGAPTRNALVNNRYACKRSRGGARDDGCFYFFWCGLYSVGNRYGSNRFRVGTVPPSLLWSFVGQWMRMFFLFIVYGGVRSGM